MLKICLEPDALEALRALLANEQDANTRLRIREFKSGCV